MTQQLRSAHINVMQLASQLNLNGDDGRPRKDTALYFTQLISISAHRILLVGHLYLEETEPSISRVMMLDQGSWYHLYDLPDIIHDTLLIPSQNAQGKDVFCFLGRMGLLREHPSGQSPYDQHVPLANPYLKCLSSVAGTLYVCGTQNQVLKRQEQHWQRMDQGIFRPLKNQLSSSLNALAGANAQDIYAVGDSGALWHFNGQQWNALDSPTNLHLYDLCLHSDGSLVIAGAGGVIFKGDKNQGWHDLSDPSFAHLTLRHTCQFGDAMYFCGGHALLRYTRGNLSVVDIPLQGSFSFHNIDSRDGRLWVIGDEQVLSFDGHTWQAYSCPEN